MNNLPTVNAEISIEPIVTSHTSMGKEIALPRCNTQHKESQKSNSYSNEHPDRIIQLR